jgi:undecaprenyl diphosphate synthase
MTIQLDTIPLGLRPTWSAPMDEPQTRLQHLGIVVGGHRHWANKAHLPEGVALATAIAGLLEVIYFCAARRARRVTVYGFVDDLCPCPSQVNRDTVKLTLRHLKTTLTTLSGKDIQVRIVGNLDKLSPAVRILAQQAQDITAHNTGTELILSIDGFQGQTDPATLVNSIPQGLAVPELVIRCGGSLPVDRPMFWDTSETALYATELLWPEFDIDVFKAALKWYRRTERGNSTWVQRRQ